jgi:hypothetical protein
MQKKASRENLNTAQEKRMFCDYIFTNVMCRQSPPSLNVPLNYALMKVSAMNCPGSEVFVFVPE